MEVYGEAWVALAAILVPVALGAMNEAGPRARARLGTGALLILVALVGRDLLGPAAGTTLVAVGGGLLLFGRRGECRSCAGPGASSQVSG